MADAGGLPPSQDLSSEYVIEDQSRYGIQRVRDTSVPQILVWSVIGGGFITMGALFSILFTEANVALPFSFAFGAAHRGAAEGHRHRMV